MVVANRTPEEIQKDVAESIRAIAEQVIASADEYAVGMLAMSRGAAAVKGRPGAVMRARKKPGS